MMHEELLQKKANKKTLDPSARNFLNENYYWLSLSCCSKTIFPVTNEL